MSGCAEPELLTGWGRTAPTRALVAEPASVEDACAALRAAGARGAIARGLGRSYGDAAQNAGGTVLRMTGLRGRVELDERSGLVTAAAGTSLDELLDVVVTRGWLPAVLPGTAQVTLGGAIAADVHGKSHHRDGSFSRWVRALTLLAPDGSVRRVTPDGDPAAFASTAGGMGLTGVIADATLQLVPTASGVVMATVQRTEDLDETFAALTRADAVSRYTVAWVDLLAPGRRLGRGIVISGDLAPEGAGAGLVRATAPRVRLAATPWAPSGVLTGRTVRAFNAAWFAAHRPATERPVALRRFFFPLDGISGWNRLYGRGGLVQYQVVVPAPAAGVLRRVVERLRDAGCPSLLTVLKRLGGEAGPLAFPMAGWTLALDIPAARPGLAALLDGCDELVAEAGGRVYLAKDARVKPGVLEAMYPRLREWRAVRDDLDPERRLRSDLARRLGLI